MKKWVWVFILTAQVSSLFDEAVLVSRQGPQAVIISVGPVSGSLKWSSYTVGVTTCAKQISSIQHTLSDVFIVYHIDHANRPVNNWRGPCKQQGRKYWLFFLLEVKKDTGTFVHIKRVGMPNVSGFRTTSIIATKSVFTRPCCTDAFNFIGTLTSRSIYRFTGDRIFH